MHLRQARAAVACDPAHELGRDEVLRLAAHLPDAAVRLLPVLDRRLDRSLEDRPHDLGQEVARLRVQVDRIEHRAPHVVLHLLVRGVADAHRPRPLVATQVVDGLLGQLVLATDPVHDLQVLLPRRHVGDEIEEIVRLAGEAERVEAPQHEGPVANPRVAVVPVALAADRLRQRGRGRRKQRAGGAVGEAFQGQGAALQEALPGVFWKLAPVDPLAPEVRGALDTLKRLLSGRRRRVLVPVLLAGRVARARPHQRGVRALALAQGLRRMRAGAFETDAKIGHQADGHLVLAAARDRLVVSRAGVIPRRGRLTVVEDRLAVEAQLDAAHDAPRGAQQDVLGLAVRRRPAVGAGAALAVIPGPDAHRVPHDEPAGARAPRRLEHQRARQVAASRGHLHPSRSEAEAAGSAVQDGGEDARAVRSREAHPLYPSARGDQAVDLAVGEEGVLGDGRERARDMRSRGLGLRLGRGRAAVPVDRRGHRLA